MLHSFPFSVSSSQLPQQFTYPFCYTPHPLIEWAARYVAQLYRPNFKNVKVGKMMGVLLVQDNQDKIGYLAAYSGEMTSPTNFFVPPIVDYSDSDGFFKKHNDKIVEINNLILAEEQSSNFISLQQLVKQKQEEKQRQISDYKQQIKINKQRRDALRHSSSLTSSEIDALIKQSQFEKAELKRLENRLYNELQSLLLEIDAKKDYISSLKDSRKQMSAALQGWLFAQYTLLNALGEAKSLDVIFQEEGRSVPPSGAGDCCAPRLLQYAYSHALKPLAMGEFWVGPSPDNVLRTDGQFYPSCQRKCKPILAHMLKGLSVEPNPLQKEADKGLPIVYEDQWLVVINKPSGLQTIPGLTLRDSVSERMQLLYPQCTITPAHRLDQFTSGLLIVAKSKDVLSAMHRQFEERRVKKRYVALLEHRPLHDSGTISLPIGFDPDDSCRRMVDKENGKEAITRYRIIGSKNGYPLVEFFPETGRTHQLRIHSAHLEGLAAPIVGDGLYGKRGEPMYLCACGIQFEHPVTADFVKLELSENEWFIF